jgi:dihydrofolate reductase
MPKIIVYIATSADGYIARPDGDVAWLDRPRTAGDYGMGAFYKSVDTVLMGRKTYDIALKFGQKSYPGKRNLIFSRTRRRSATPNVEFVSPRIPQFAQALREGKGKDIWLVGGAELVAAFLDAGYIDEFIIHVVPKFIGAGIPLIHPRHRAIPLTLLSSRAYSDGVVRLHYAASPVGPEISSRLIRKKRKK